jgi:hypothetical protein
MPVIYLTKGIQSYRGIISGLKNFKVVKILGFVIVIQYKLVY